MTPLMKMHTLGHSFVPDPIHAGGLRYHGMAPLVSHIYELGLVEAESIGQTECFTGALQFARRPRASSRHPSPPTPSLPPFARPAPARSRARRR